MYEDMSNCSIDEYIEKYHPYCIYGKHGMFGNMTSKNGSINTRQLKDFDEIFFTINGKYKNLIGVHSPI